MAPPLPARLPARAPPADADAEEIDWDLVD